MKDDWRGLRQPAPQLATESHWALNTTIRCQHRCVYCFEADRPGLRDVSPDETARLIDEAVGEVPHVIFMGAEPTLNPALPALVTRAKQHGLFVSISTNALRLADRDFLSRLYDAGLDDIELSFPYPDERVYAAITGAHPKGFSRLLCALENIEELNRTATRTHAINVKLRSARPDR